MLTYGLHFSHLVVFAHTVRVTGWPYITRAADEFVEMYLNARKTIRKVSQSVTQEGMGKCVLSPISSSMTRLNSTRLDSIYHS